MNKKNYVIFGVILVAVFFCFIAFNFIFYPIKYKTPVFKTAKEFGLEPALVYAIIKTESNFNSEAVSPAGAMGLMQIIPSTAKWIAGELNEEFNENNLYNPETNIKYGCFYLKYLFDKFDNIDAVICGYNAGETIVKSWLDEKGNIDIDKISYTETKNYYKKVIGSYNVYKNARLCE